MGWAPGSHSWAKLGRRDPAAPGGAGVDVIDLPEHRLVGRRLAGGKLPARVAGAAGFVRGFAGREEVEQQT